MSENQLPVFIIGGAQKAGSTWLARMLGHHPDLYVPAKELHFFDLDENYARGKAWYADKFADAPAGQIRGEKTPDYMFVERADGARFPAADRIREMLPEVKLLFVLRDPVTRAISALRHNLWFRRLPISASPTEILFGKHRDLAESFGILSKGLYARQLRHFHDLFPAEQIRVWVFEEDIRRNPLQIIKDAASFIGVSDAKASIEQNRVSNRGVQSSVALKGNYYLPFFSAGWQVLDRMLKQKFKVSEDCIEQLTDYYTDDVAELSRMLGRDLSGWSSSS